MDGGALFSPQQEGDEVPFEIAELFYSRTDGRGVILAGNSVFQRVSCYDWPDLIGAPHRIVRNAATPKAVFRILWTTIKTGEPAVAYVCNRAADGRPYWVLATVLPFEDGYLSIRLKPTSALFSTVKALYGEVVGGEAQGQSIEAGLEAIGTSLQALGHGDYRSFMRAALWAEMTARAKALGRELALPNETVLSIRAGLADSLASQRQLHTEFEAMKILPTNLSILAARLEPEGGPLGAVAGLYMAGTMEVLAQIRAFTSGEQSLCSRMSERFERAIYMVLSSQLQREMGERVRGEDWSGAGQDPEAEIAHLDLLGHDYEAAAMQAIEEACDLAKAIERAGAELRRSMLSLETVTVMGKVEGSRLGAEGDRIRTTIESLHLLNAEISRVLGRIGDLSAVIDRGMSEIRASFRAAAREGRAARRAEPPAG
jgi:aerotaxis receptor